MYEINVMTWITVSINTKLLDQGLYTITFVQQYTPVNINMKLTSHS